MENDSQSQSSTLSIEFQENEMNLFIQEVNFIPISREKKENLIKHCLKTFSVPHLHEKYQHLIEEEKIIPVEDFDEEYSSPKPKKKVKFTIDKENYKKLTKSAEKKIKGPTLEKLLSFLSKGEDIMTILNKPHYRDLALENRTIILGKLKSKEAEQFKDFMNSFEKSVVTRSKRTFG